MGHIAGQSGQIFLPVLIEPDEIEYNRQEKDYEQ
jgi:hypothetical protein